MKIAHLFIALALAATPAFAGVLPGPVVTPDWLAAHRDEVAVLDVRDDAAGFSAEPKYGVDAKTGQKVLTDLGGHVPGAFMVEFSKIRTERVVDGRKIPVMIPEAEQVETLMRNAGLPAGKPIVIVSQATIPEEIDSAARVYWTLKYYGATELAILDGGMARWIEEGHPVESTPAAPATTGDWSASKQNPAIAADSAQVAKASESGRTQLIDARPPAYFYGLQKKPSVASFGHIAKAYDFPAELHARPVAKSQRFLSAAEYRTIFSAMGVKSDKPVIAYCNTGHMAAGAWFIASEILGNRNAALYDGSMLRWAAEGRPVVTTLK